MKTFAEAIMTYIKYTIIGLLCLGGVVTCSIVSKGCSWLGKAADVASQQVDPALLLKRYEWFKEMAAECDKKLADIKVYESRELKLEAWRQHHKVNISDLIRDLVQQALGRLKPTPRLYWEMRYIIIACCSTTIPQLTSSSR